MGLAVEEKYLFFDVIIYELSVRCLGGNIQQRNVRQQVR